VGRELVLVLVLVLATGCRFTPGVGTAADGAPGDGKGDGPGAVDAAVDAPLGAFGSPEVITELSSGGGFINDDPSLTADMLEIYFNSNRGGADDIWCATRANVNDAWEPPVRVDALSTTSRESDPEISADGLVIWFASTRAGSPNNSESLWRSTRLDRDSPWAEPALVVGVNSTAVDSGPGLDPAQQHLMFYSNRTGGAGGADLYQSRYVGGAWTTPVRVVELATASQEYDPYLDPTARILFFDSDRPGGEGMQDLYVAERPSVTEPFGPPIPIAELNTSARDMDPWLSPDLRTIVFASNRSGQFEIYVARR
jgi:Tol biopolymer transport system component